MDDLKAGLVSILVNIPLAMGIGIVAGMGVTAALYSAVIVGIVSALLGGTRALKSGPSITAGRRRRCRRCGQAIVENARKRGAAWSICAPCANAIEDDARRAEIAPPLIRRCLVCRELLGYRRRGARTCGPACRALLSRILRR